MTESEKLLKTLKAQGATFLDEDYALLTINQFLKQSEFRRHADVFLANNPDRGIVIVGSGSTGSSVRQAVEIVKRDFSEVLVVAATPLMEDRNIQSERLILKDRENFEGYQPSAKEIHNVLHGKLPQKEKHRKKRPYF